jgi:hypothetical protein
MINRISGGSILPRNGRDTSVKVRDLVGADAYICPLNPVAGESYWDMLITPEMEEISVVLSNGEAISLSY